VLIHVDTGECRAEQRSAQGERRSPLHSRLAYVSISRGRYDAQIYTNDAEKLGGELSRTVSKQSALETEHETGGQDQGHAAEKSVNQSVSESHEQGQGYGMKH
jgi:hypothetical protein